MGANVLVQIPVYNEEATIEEVIAGIPRNIAGVEQVTIVLINDGSDDRTVARARGCGVDYVLDLSLHQGLASAFKKGIEYGVAAGADIIVNTDGDNQYSGYQIPLLVEPILAGQADMVIGARNFAGIVGYPRYKRLTQWIGSRLVSGSCGVSFDDVTSGFRAMTSQVAQIFFEGLQSEYTYTLESIYLALRAGKRVASVPIAIHYPTRPSRLIRSKGVYVYHFLKTVWEQKRRKGGSGRCKQ